ncbi:MAG: hypothetical protein FWF30_02035 [Coriobacteriia bacterium]|nr:hypothetical protein [Coriobacteriia bacterium]
MGAESQARLWLAGRLAPQTLLLAALILVVGIVLGGRSSLVVALAALVAVLLLTIIVQARLRRMLLRSLVVLPVVGVIALFMPFRYVQEWTLAGLGAAYSGAVGQMLSLVLIPWTCLLVMLLLLELCSQADLLYALERLRLPRFLLLLLNFSYRYVSSLRQQLRASHRALVSRAPLMSRRRQVRLYGNLAGSMLIRSHDRGERVHAAMQARGYNGLLPRLVRQKMQAADLACLAAALFFAACLVLL